MNSQREARDEAGRLEDEGPQHRVSVEPFWMGKFEVTWAEYEPFMITGVARNKDGSPESIPADAAVMDIVSSPTTPYTEMSFGMGTDGYPAICMTQHAANRQQRAQTGHYYRLPTEAEWEYACRAGSTGPFSCPEEELADYAVMDPEAVRVGYEKIGTKKPNPWGLYDMHGNVMEWVLDQYIADAYGTREEEVNVNPLEIPTTLYPRIARGGFGMILRRSFAPPAVFGQTKAGRLRTHQVDLVSYRRSMAWLPRDSPAQSARGRKDERTLESRAQRRVISLPGGYNFPSYEDSKKGGPCGLPFFVSFGRHGFFAAGRRASGISENPASHGDGSHPADLCTSQRQGSRFGGIQEILRAGGAAEPDRFGLPSQLCPDL